MITKVTSIQELNDWLKNNEELRCEFERDDYNFYIIRIPQNDYVDYLYAAMISETGTKPSKNTKFEYIGFFSKRDKVLYDIQYPLNTLYYINNFPMPKRWDEIKKEVSEAVREKIVELIGNDRNKLNIQGITDPKILQYLAYARAGYAAKKAREKFFVNDRSFRPDNLQNIPSYEDESLLLSYIAFPADFLETEAKEYIKNNQESVLYAFMFMDLVKKEYVSIEQNPDSDAHLVKKMIHAMKNTPAKMVNVTIRNGEKEEEFKFAAELFKNDYQEIGYPMWSLSNKDMERFKNLFPEKRYYLPIKNIMQITYKKKVLYKGKPDAKAL